MSRPVPGGTIIEPIRFDSPNWSNRYDTFIPGFNIGDTGCTEVSDSCLSCPIPQCIYDKPLQTQIHYCRLSWISYLTRKNFNLKEICEILNLQKLTVQKAKKKTFDIPSEIYHEYINNQWLSNKVVNYNVLKRIKNKKEEKQNYYRYGTFNTNIKVSNHPDMNKQMGDILFDLI